MPFFKLCDKDPLVDTLMSLFRANIIRVPEERIQPLSVIARSGNELSFRGQFHHLLQDPTPLAIEAQSSTMADLSGTQSRKVNLDIGLGILDGFLKGFGVPSAGIKAKFETASRVSFTFADVNRNYIDANELGMIITNRRLNPNHPAGAIFFYPASSTLLLIDSAITSKSFTINVEQSGTQEVDLDVEGIKQIISGANIGVSVSSSTGYDLTFKGPKELAFAFTCLQFELQADGTVTALAPDSSPGALGSQDDVLLSARPGMWELSDASI